MKSGPLGALLRSTHSGIQGKNVKKHKIITDFLLLSKI